MARLPVPTGHADIPLLAAGDPHPAAQANMDATTHPATHTNAVAHFHTCAPDGYA